MEARGRSARIDGQSGQQATFDRFAAGSGSLSDAVHTIGLTLDSCSHLHMDVRFEASQLACSHIPAPSVASVPKTNTLHYLNEDVHTLMVLLGTAYSSAMPCRQAIYATLVPIEAFSHGWVLCSLDTLALTHLKATSSWQRLYPFLAPHHGRSWATCRA